ncbi:hypothetical protein JX265_007247 [Neoarthrinium moseri]|uniref:Uncharacterized protein n=1 Tax=Neoarthrinium moseri TaxID=1658444 RepID=A0A9P9WK19_9PEZI|nr:hypothetical protein JX265_007247 [Neoarthrinium moseri]
MRRYEGIWRKAQLVPCWVLQCLASGIFLIAAGLLIAAAAYVSQHSVDSDYTYYGYTADDLAKFAAISGGVIFALAIITIIFDIIECVLYARRTLSPVLLLVFAVLKTLAWGVYFVLAIIAAASGTFSWVDFLLSLVLVATSLVQLVFGAKNTHRKRKGTLDNRGNYKAATTGHVEGQYAGVQYPPSYPQPYNPAPYAGNNLNPNPFNDSTYRSPSPAPSYNQQPAQTAYRYAGQQGVEMQPQKPAHYQ